MSEIREVLRSWLGGDGLRTAGERAGVDRKTARRYVEAAQAAGLAREGGEGQLSDELIGAVVQYVSGNFFAGEQFADLADAQRRALAWCTGTAGRRLHGTTAQRPG